MIGRVRLTGTCVALALAGCGGSGERPARPPSPAATPAAQHGRAVIRFRRVRYMGATMRILTVYRDGAITVEIPNGGAGGSVFAGRLTRRTARAIRHEVASAPWRHLSHREVRLDASGAYFMLRHRGIEHVAFADGMSRDLLPLVRRLNGVLNGQGRARYDVVHRYFTP